LYYKKEFLEHYAPTNAWYAAASNKPAASSTFDKDILTIHPPS
jgi:hypothetical protein